MRFKTVFLIILGIGIPLHSYLIFSNQIPDIFWFTDAAIAYLVAGLEAIIILPMMIWFGIWGLLKSEHDKPKQLQDQFKDENQLW